MPTLRPAPTFEWGYQVATSSVQADAKFLRRIFLGLVLLTLVTGGIIFALRGLNPFSALYVFFVEPLTTSWSMAGSPTDSATWEATRARPPDTASTRSPSAGRTGCEPSASMMGGRAV